MAFENNQQDAFNLRNDTESLKQWQSELDKATTSIGAAEVAAEEELAALKFKNLSALQDAQVAKLEQLIALEDKGIRELAKARLTLSDRQFELRKKEIQKEFQLAKNAAEELLKIKSKKTQTSVKKPTPSTKDITAASKAKSKDTTTVKKDFGKTVQANNIKKISETKNTTPEVISLLSSIDETLGSLRDAVASYLPSKEESSPIIPIEPVKPTESTKATVQPPALPKNQEIANDSLAEIIVGEDLLGVLKAGVEALLTTTEQRLTSIKAQYEARDTTPTIAEDVKEALAKTTSADEPSKPIAMTINIKGTESLSAPAPVAELTNAIETVAEIFKSQKPSEANIARLDEAKLGEELLNVLKAGIEALLTTTEQRLANLKISQESDNKVLSVAEDIKDALTKTDKSDDPEQSSEKASTDGTTVPPPKTEAAKPKAPEGRDYSDDSAGLERVKLGEYSLEAIKTGFDTLRDQLKDQQNFSALKVLNNITSDKSSASQSSIDLAGALLDNIKAAGEAEEKLNEFTKNKTLNSLTLITTERQRLERAHFEIALEAIKEEARAKAQARDIEKNANKYLEEATQNLRIGHAKKENGLRLASINAEAKAKDLANNKEQYILEARIARENAFYEERNRLEEERINAETELAWEKAHSDESLAQELQKKRLGYLKEYQEYQKKAGKYAVSQEEFERNRAKKDNAAKKETADGITDALSGRRFSMAEIRESYGEYMGLRTAELRDSGMSEASAELTARFELLAEVSGNLAQQLNAQTDKIGEKQAPIDTRLQGSQANDKILGSYWKQLARDMNKIGAVNPYFKQEDFANNIEALVNKGISFDIKQRAFLMTIQEKIANTFDAADGTLLRLIRIQQQDTTAGRLGMESALNSFLNSMYETSEYLTDVASSVRSSLLEMQAFESGDVAAELEFQIQKWMGSLYSVGMSQDAVQGIAQAFGQIASGDVSGLTGNGTGNLLIMAANEAGKSIADILQEGLDAKETNELMQAMVNYLAEIAETSSDSRVVQQQLANVYGIKASDLRAATNLASSIKDVSNQDLTYSGMIGQLNKMANSMILRTSTGEMLSNVWDNVQYTMATQMSNDPILYLLPRVATLLEDYAGGIDIPFLNVMGFGVDLNTSVAQLMNVAAMSGSILGALGPMISGLAGAVSGSAMLSLAGINTSGKAPVIARGAPAVLQNVSGSSISESGYIGNSSGDDVKNATLQDAEDSKKKQMVEAKEEESSDDVVIRAQLAAVNIYNLLEEVAHGSQSLRVRVINNNGYGGSASGNIANGQNQVIGETNTNPTSNNMSTDNGNWVLTF